MSAMSGLKDAYTTQELAGILGLTVKSVLKRASRESWQSRPRSGRGGGHEWLLASMPEKTRLVLASRLCEAPAAITADQQAGLAAVTRLKGKSKARAEAKAALLSIASTFTTSLGLRESPALELFAARWNAGEIAAEAWLREAVPSVTRQTLRNWKKGVHSAGVVRLSGNYGKRKGSGRIDAQPLVQEIILGMLGKNPHVSGQLVMERLEAFSWKQQEEGGPALALPSLRRLQDWMRQWKIRNEQTWLFLQSPDKWRSYSLASHGSAYELIVRYNQLWEYDGTPADLLLNDGKRYAIVGVINVYSRELKLEVAERSSASTVANLTRRAILDWGVPEEVVTDNGKEFTAVHMQQLFIGLDILLHVLPPFRPELKPAIERVFRTFSHHLLTLAPCYVGHNVATRQEIRERESFAKRLFQPGEELSMAISPEELQAFCDKWTDKVYAHKPHGGLKGKTPYEVALPWRSVARKIGDERALDVLLVELASNRGLRTVTKKGVREKNELYVSPALEALAGQQVRVRVGKDDRDKALVFTVDNEFICEAVNVTKLDRSERKAEAMEARRSGRAHVVTAAKAIRDMGKRTRADRAFTEILDYHEARANAIEAGAEARAEASSQASNPVYTSKGLSEAAKAVRARTEGPAATLTEEQRRAVEARARELLAESTAWKIPTSDAEKWVEHCRIRAALEAGVDVPFEQSNWSNAWGNSRVARNFEAVKLAGQQAMAKEN